MKIRLDVDACVGHGRCYAVAPEVFEPDDRGHCIVRLADVPDGLAEQARTGVRSCPEDALAVDDG
jgi:ferredoxin